MAVIAVLMSLLLPAMRPVKETARQVVCRSGVRQIGLSIAMFADDNRSWLPKTVWTAPKLHQTVYLRLSGSGSGAGSWDALGHLYSKEYLRTPGVFYCPSHTGEFRRVDNLWRWKTDNEPIIGNYQYRGSGPKATQTTLAEIEPKASALVVDSLRHVSEYSHRVGANVLRADLSVFWFHDTGAVAGQLGSGTGETGLTQATSLSTVWSLLDSAR